MRKVKLRDKIVFGILRPFIRLFVKMKYNTTVFKYKLEKGPHVILSNHLTILDPLILSSSFSRPVYFMASEDLSSSKYGKLITFFFNPIYKAKSKSDLAAVKDCLRVVKSGGTICIFPEGNRSYDGNLCNITDSIAKMVKLLKVPVVLYNIKGGYGTDPRWCKRGRKGPSYTRVKRVLSIEEINELTNEELYDLIVRELTVPQVPTIVPYKSNQKAEGLERILYICPKCGKLHGIYTKGDYVYCKYCDLTVKYNEYLKFECEDESFKYNYVYEWYNQQKDYVKTYTLDKKFEYFDDEVTIFTVEKGSVRKALKTGRLSMNNATIAVEDLSFDLSTVENITILGKHKMNMYFQGKTYQFIGNDSCNMVKYLHMYCHLYNKEETV